MSISVNLRAERDAAAAERDTTVDENNRLRAAGNAPIAAEALQRIAGLYAREAEIRGQPATEWLRPTAKLTADHRRAEAPARGEARRGVAQGDPLRTLPLGRPRAPPRRRSPRERSRRAMRPIALGRKNHLFAGSDGGARHWAVLASLIKTAKLNGIDPRAWMTGAIARYVDGHPQSRLNEIVREVAVCMPSCRGRPPARPAQRCGLPPSARRCRPGAAARGDG
jgi:transposase